ncbi:CbtA family protein [Nocardioides sp.]|uniref:CbtA family protein n=1 Tax=Nocardioides sp. TaxID=35761 RepID=UPI002C9F0379|nr:CbtA family protein [Nocardioides sp.]HSX68033.1 CbtA family protein [Nocardioides sp.]
MGIADLLRRGLAAGAAAGCAAALFIWLVVEPVLERALKVEDARSAEHTHEIEAQGGHVHAEIPLVDRPEQILGGMVTVLIVGILFGVVFAVVFAALRHRLPGATDLGRSLWLAAIGFGVFVLAPTLTLPANPPAVGDPGSVDQRTGIFVLTIVLAALLVVAAFVANAQLTGKVADTTRIALVTVGFTVAAGVCLYLVPASPDGIASDMGAQLVWDFRLTSIGLRAVLFGGLGLAFGLLVSRKAATTGAHQSVAA